MIDFNKFHGFLNDKNVYSENVGLYEKLVHKITNETVSEWMITKFANGTDIGDGNPIYSAYVENKKLAVRIIQTKVDANAPIFNAWINKNPYDMTDVKELVISLQLRQDTYEDLSHLIKTFINKPLSNHIIEFLNDKYHTLSNEIKSEALQV